MIIVIRQLLLFFEILFNVKFTNDDSQFLSMQRLFFQRVYIYLYVNIIFSLSNINEKIKKFILLWNPDSFTNLYQIGYLASLK